VCSLLSLFVVGGGVFSVVVPVLGVSCFLLIADVLD
jgi:hypothetical protein